MASERKGKSQMSNSIKLREPGKLVFHPKPKLTLIKPATERKAMRPASELSPEVKEMLREMNRRQKKERFSDEPDAA
jgi:hypothetical protein